ncbi:MAG: choice-of-anchor J domain-containing protein [Bacteroidales bacterium]|nr:choice-of-anchor J domain-containing protein [Bacteroidales bacterium]
MKKLFTLLFVLFAFVAVNAQNYILQEGFEGATCPPTGWTIVYADDSAALNTMTHSTTQAYEGSQSFRFSSYSSTTDYTQYLITPELTLTDSVYVAFFYRKHSASYNEPFQVGFSSTTNAVSAFTWMDTTTDATNTDWTFFTVKVPSTVKYVAIKYEGNYAYYLYIDNFFVATQMPSELFATNVVLSPSIVPTGVDANGTFDISAMNINDSITVAVANPFSVSLDGTQYQNTVTIPAPTAISATYNVYVRFNSATPGVFTDSILVSSGSVSAMVPVTGEAVVCSAIDTLPFTYDFNTGVYPPVCWTSDDASNFTRVSYDTIGVNYGLAFLDEAMVVTPEINTNTPMMLSFDYSTYLGAYATSKFSVGYSTTTNDETAFTWLETISVSDDGDFTYNQIIPANTKYVAVKMTEMGSYVYIIFSYDNYLFIDNFSLTAITSPVMMVAPSSLDFGSLVLGSSKDMTVNVAAALLTGDIAVTAPASYSVSNDGSTYADTATLPAAGGTLYVRYAPISAGTHTGSVTLTNGSLTETVSVTGNATDCSSPMSLPFTEDFEDALSACWLNIDADGDGFVWNSTIEDGVNASANTGDGCYYSESYVSGSGALNNDNWLITPAIAIPTEGANLTWYVAAQDPSYPAEYYEVKVSTSTLINSFTTIFSETLSTDEWLRRSVNLTGMEGQNVYIAFRHTNGNDQFWMKIDDITVTAGLSGVENRESLATIYPNPANNVLNINANSNISMVEVFNVMGQMVASFNANDVNTQINTSNFANGVYTVRIHTENGVSNQKFTVAR